MGHLRALWLQSPQGGLSGPAALREEVIWHVTFPRQDHLCQPDHSTGWSTVLLLGKHWRGQACANGMMMFKWQKSSLLHSHQLCSAKPDVIKLIKPEIGSVTYYLMMKLQPWLHWYSLHFTSVKHSVYFSWHWPGLSGVSICIKIFFFFICTNNRILLVKT